MVIIPDYTIRYKPQLDAFLVIDFGPLPPCPICGGELRYRDSRPRIRRREGGKKERLIIHRLRCEDCHSYHNELPDCLVPHKHYDAETISGATRVAEPLKQSDRSMSNSTTAKESSAATAHEISNSFSE